MDNELIFDSSAKKTAIFLATIHHPISICLCKYTKQLIENIHCIALWHIHILILPEINMNLL